jgi:hypothetical protein
VVHWQKQRTAGALAKLVRLRCIDLDHLEPGCWVWLFEGESAALPIGDGCKAALIRCRVVNRLFAGEESQKGGIQTLAKILDQNVSVRDPREGEEEMRGDVTGAYGLSLNLCDGPCRRRPSAETRMPKCWQASAQCSP